MPTITLNKKEFEKLVGKELPLDELKDRISMLGTDLEGIEGNEIEVEVFPNRPDMLSEQGFARAFSSFIGQKTGLRNYDVVPSENVVAVDGSVAGVRPYTVCAIIKGLSLDDEKIREIVQVQEKLHVTHCRKRKKGAIGIYPMESITFPITYCAKAPSDIRFRPLEEDREMSAEELLLENPTGQEYGHLLEGLDAYPLFIDATGAILSMPPIINAHRTGKVTEDTTEVFIECSGFDRELLEHCLNILVTAFADMGGSIHSVTLEYPDGKRTTPDLTPATMPLDTAYINKRLGLQLTYDEVSEYLRRMGYDVDDGTVHIPAYRTDIMHPVDLVEDVAIAYGYENFEPELPEKGTVAQEAPFSKFKAIVADILIGRKLLEVNTFHLTNAKLQREYMNNPSQPVIRLQNALSHEFDTLRSWVLPSVLEVLSENKHNEFPQNIFCMGSAFMADSSKETGIKEPERLVVSLCGENATFTSIMQELDYLLRMLGSTYEVIEAEHPSFIPGRVGRIKVGEKKVAYIGEVHPQVLSNWKIEQPVAAFELNLTDLFALRG